MRSRVFPAAIAVAAAAAFMLAPAAAKSAVSDPCGADSNPIVCENSKPGTAREDWFGESAWGDVGGFATHMSVRPGETLQLKVQSSTTFTLGIYRLGYYRGDGARRMPTSPTNSFPAWTQPACLHDAETGLVDCGNWTTNVTWTVPPDAVSGVYLAMLEQPDGAGFAHVPFVVTDDSSHSDILVQTSDQTWQAYNDWGGQDLYGGAGPAPDGRAYKVSYNRPMRIAGDNGILAAEYPMIYWLERNGYDVSYASSIDVSTKPSILPNHKVFMSSGHDEYWNQGQWDNVVAAREAGVNLAFFSGNEIFWRTRLEPSIALGGGDNRTLVCYKMTKMRENPPNGIADPSGQWTGTWADPAGAGSGGATPPNQLTGTIFTVNGYRNDAITVPADYRNLRLWRNIPSINDLAPGEAATFPVGTLGYEWDSDVENSVRPPGAIAFSATTLAITDGTLLLDAGNTYGNGTATHSLVAYRDQSSGALVFGAGTVQWSWGLSSLHTMLSSSEDQRMQQATVNLLADMGAQPLTRQADLVAATASTDSSGPTVTITAPQADVTLPVLTPVTITGTATEVGGGQLGRVEVSTDGGLTWAPATGQANWSYTWTPTSQGPAQIMARASDDSLNIGAAATQSVTIGPQQCPCTAFPPTAVPTGIDSADPSATELGVKFHVGAPSLVTGVKFYKASTNTGTHVGKLWTSTGQLLASGTFTDETASGWQTLTFADPVPVAANTTYVASYYTPTGHYSYTSNYFTDQGAGLSAVRLLQSGVDGGNGVYRYGADGGFPDQSWNDTNYWVDVVVDTAGAQTEPPTITANTPAAGASDVALNATVTATFSHAVDPQTIKFSLTSPGGSVPATVHYDNTTGTVSLQPQNALTPTTTYTASVQATDAWGNAMPTPYTWTFTTGTSVRCPCSVWNDSVVPATPSASEVNSLELGLRFTSAIDGYVTGVRFYKGSTNTGTHTGTLWSNTGKQLATATFTNESSSGWQTVTFDVPVPITANTPYVVSYHTDVGHYAYTGNYFTQPTVSYPLTAVADSPDAGNGLFRSGAGVAFPTSTWNSANYWVDVVFTTTP